MMKIVTDDDIFMLPVESDNIYLLASDYSETILNCLNLYFGSKKKTICNIYHEDHVIGNKEFNFVYFPSGGPVEANILFKQKSIMNTEFAKLISENPNDFRSVEHIRNDLFDLLTDKGFYTFSKIINRGLEKYYKVELNEFNMNLLLQMFSFDIEVTEYKYVYMMIYNLMIYLNRNKPTIVYLDIEIDSVVADWFNSIDKSNLIILIDNDNCHVSSIQNCNMIILNKTDYYDSYELDESFISLVSYLFKPLIRKNMQYQLEKNIRLYSNFNNKETTFLINFTSENPANSL